MSTQKDFRVQHLQEDETWILFKNTAGDSIENPELQPIAVEVAKECAGLPIAIVTVAKALKNKNVSIWKDALQQLKSQTSTNITGMETKVYSSLKLSYEHLEGDEVKSLCLLCGLFSSYIDIRDLLKYGVGLRLFQGTNTLEEAKNRIDTLVDNLKSSNFLLETGHNAVVRMHDLVRSTARKIASEQRHVFTHQKTTVRVEEWSRIDELQVTWVKLHDCDIHELPEGLLPREIAQLTHLRLLDLSDSSTIKVIPSGVISSLFRLEDLCMENSFTQWEGEGKSDVWSWGIFEANNTLKLNKFDTSLHLVDGISKLLKRTEDLHLRELCGGTNVLSKLNREGFLKLKHLNVESSPEIQYIVNSMDLTPSHGAFPVMETLSLNQLINLQEVCRGQFPAGSFGCLRKVEVKDCDGLKFLFSLSVARCLSRLVEIKVSRCESMVEMVSQGRKEIKEDTVNVPLFPELRHLTLKDLPKLSNFCFEENPVLSKPPSTIVGPSTPPLNQPEIRDGQLLLSLGGNLRSLKLKNCMSLLKLFPPSLLQNLEELIVENCGQLEHVFDLEGLNVDDGHVGLLPKLGKLRLIGLPKLRHICNCGSSRNHFSSSMASAPVGNIIFPKLSDILLESLPNLSSFVSPGYHSLQRLHHADLDTPSRCSLMKGLQSLQFLIVENCSSLEAVFDVEGTNVNVDCSSLGNTFVFPKITWLSLCNLPQLRSFYPGAHTSQWPLLEQLIVYDCHKLNGVAFPNLEELELGHNRDTEIWPEQFQWIPFQTKSIGFNEVFQLEGLDEENQARGLDGLDLQSLESLEVLDCENLINLVPSSVSFQNLATLDVQSCGSLRSLISPSVAKSLVKLKTLKIGGSDMMEEVVASEGGEATDEITFYKLQHMELLYLPNLTSFSSGGYIFSFPSLEQMLVKECPKMKMFSPSLVTTPRLERIKVGDDECLGKMI
ncbi:putative disease resistance protein [Vitis vinifera]|uniref:Putative disease resistance protein n=1 Tax=Vitis vinifera TaxID=29760 RepID=A0A438FXQ2_VITVI|nr:putative disease resistance protein [Vitis vinifera]